MKGPTARPKGLADLTSAQLQAGIERLTKLVDRVRQFDPRSVVQQYDIPNVEQLSAAIDEALVRTFGPDTLDYDRYHYAAEFDNGPHNYAYEVPIAEVHQSLSRSKSRNIALLEQAVETLRERLAEMPPSPSIADLVNAPSPTVAVREPKKSRRIFVVHGHDEGAREAVARFLEKIGFEPIILHERANQGRTVIEKVEAHSDVAFAVVLLTPDDEGCIRRIA
jgi:hypothetical protein